MNIVHIGGYVKSVSFRGTAKDNRLCADVIMDVVDEVRPDFKVEIKFTETRSPGKWRRIKPDEYVEVYGELRPAIGITSNGNLAHVCAFYPRNARTLEKLSKEEEE